MIFKYQAADANQKVINSEEVASSAEELTEILRQKNQTLISVEKLDETDKNLTIPEIEKATLFHYLSVMLASGISLADGLSGLASQAGNKSLKKFLHQVIYDISRGEPLSLAFSHFPKSFDNISMAIINSGEQSGTLSQSMEYLSAQVKSDYKLNQSVKGALLYPAIIVSTMLTVGLAILVFVVPRIGKVFISLRMPLPITTRLLLSFSFFLQKNFLLIVIAFFWWVFFSIILWKKGVGKNFVLKIAQNLPILKKIFLLIDLTRFNRTLSTLLKTGVPITQALKISFEATSLPQINSLSNIVQNEITQGLNLNIILKKYKIFPSIMVEMISAGEKSGSLEKVLNDLFVFYSEELENNLKNLAQILEPLLMVAVGIAVAIMVLSIISPIYSLVGGLSIK